MRKARVYSNRLWKTWACPPAPTTASCAWPAPSPTWKARTTSRSAISPKLLTTGVWIGNCGRGRMGESMEFEIRFSPHAREHVKALRKRDQQIILEAISVNLCHEPEKKTRNRKLL